MDIGGTLMPDELWNMPIDEADDEDEILIPNANVEDDEADDELEPCLMEFDLMEACDMGLVDLEDKPTEEPMEYIDRVGTELEGSYERSKLNSSKCWCKDPTCSGMGEKHDDGSIEVNGDEGGECNCSENCECDMCRRCISCEELTDECSCSCCMMCQSCDRHVDNCRCDMSDESCDTCKRIGRGETQAYWTTPDGRGACEECYDNFRAENWIYNCEGTEHARYMCRDPVDCGCCSCCESERIDKELVSPILRRKDLARWTENHYPDEVNGSCSAHLHVSFKKIRSYSILMNRRFTETITTGLKAWGAEHNIRNTSNFWNRVHGTCERWCSHIWRAYEQVNAQTKGDFRYTTINYCYTLRNTMEFRVAHIFQDKKLTVKQHERILSIIDEYLTKERNSMRTLYLGLNTNIGGEE